MNGHKKKKKHSKNIRPVFNFFLSLILKKYFQSFVSRTDFSCIYACSSYVRVCLYFSPHYNRQLTSRMSVNRQKFGLCTKKKLVTVLPLYTRIRRTEILMFIIYIFFFFTIFYVLPTSGCLEVFCNPP